MLGALYSGITGMDAAEMGMDVIGNNVANVQTTAFKAGGIHFASVYADSVSILGGSSGNEQGKGVQVVALDAIWEQGTMNPTSNSLDCGISGEGFFGVVDAVTSTTYYSRDGHFSFDEDATTGIRYLTNFDGLRVQGYAYDTTSGTYPGYPGTYVDISYDPSAYSDVKIEGEGIIRGYNTTTGVRETISRITLYNFSNKEGLRKMTGNIYEESLDSGSPVGDVSSASGYGSIETSHLELSNVNLANEFVNLITTQKAFQANSRVIGSSAEILSEVINIIR